MKKRIVTLLMLMTCGLVFSGCKKKESAPATTEATTEAATEVLTEVMEVIDDTTEAELIIETEDIGEIVIDEEDIEAEEGGTDSDVEIIDEETIVIEEE